MSQEPALRPGDMDEMFAGIVHAFHESHIVPDLMLQSMKHTQGLEPAAATQANVCGLGR